jgi:O-methyltransferase domain
MYSIHKSLVNSTGQRSCRVTSNRAKLSCKAWFHTVIADFLTDLYSTTAHDFFEPQPVKNAAAFLLRQIAHDWSDDAVLKILSHLRASATPKTKLIVVDQVVPYASKSLAVDAIPGAARPSAPAPLLPNLGAASATVYWSDLQVCLGDVGTGQLFIAPKTDVLIAQRERTYRGRVRRRV